MVEMGVIASVLGIVVFVILLPVLFSTVAPTYTLNPVVNESVVITANAGQLAHYPVDNTVAPVVWNTTDTFTISTDYNITLSTGAVVTGGAIETTPVLVVYSWQPSGYLTGTTERAIASNIFVLIILGLFVMAAFMVGKGG